jgi:hypothetical protein
MSARFPVSPDELNARVRLLHSLLHTVYKFRHESEAFP